MTEKMESLRALEEHLGVKSWPDLTQAQTYELLKLAGQEKVTTAVLGMVVEAAPALRELAVQSFESFRETVKGQLSSQTEALAIMRAGFDSFDRFRVMLMDAWATVNDPERIAGLIQMVSRQMVEILVLVERMNADNNRSWRAAFAAVVKTVTAIVAVGGAVAVAARNRS